MLSNVRHCQVKNGVLLLAISARNGEKLAEFQLDELPVLDGMIVAENRVLISTQCGMLICLSGSFQVRE
jgi:hypothetical protein